MMLLFNPIIAMIHDNVNNRWHPVLFEERPLPGPHNDSKPIRHKSKGHHTTGFATQEEANANAKEMLEKLPEAKLRLDVVFPWDGQGIPAIIHFFDATPLNPTPALDAANG
jgi:hypothetical protein